MRFHPALAALCFWTMGCAHLPAVATSSLHPARRATTWSAVGWQNVAVTDRVYSATGVILDYLRAENEAEGVAEVPRHAYAVTAIADDTKAALSDLPPVVQRLIASTFVGVFLLRGLGSTAYAETILDENGDIAGGWVALDADRIDRTANAWASYRDLSAFAATTPSNLVIVSTIAEPTADTRQAAIQYIVLHELGHIVAASRPDVHPRWDRDPPSSLRKFPYSNSSWHIVDGKYVRRASVDFDPGIKIRYYARDAGSGLPETTALSLYGELQTSSFPSLYAAQSPFEDFAESFASYVHVVLLGRPWHVDVSWNRTTVRLTDCWAEPRCKTKRYVLEKLLAE